MKKTKKAIKFKDLNLIERLFVIMIYVGGIVGGLAMIATLYLKSPLFW